MTLSNELKTYIENLNNAITANIVPNDLQDEIMEWFDICKSNPVHPELYKFNIGKYTGLFPIEIDEQFTNIMFVTFTNDNII